MARVAVEQIAQVTRAALMRHGAAEWIADEVARAVAEAESLGNHICGLYYLQSYCQQLHSGRVRGDVTPVVSRPRPGVVHVDAGFGFAQPAFAKGLPEALRAVAQNGVASLGIAQAHTCTSLGYFTAQIARAGYVGFGATNAAPVVAPPGGRHRVIGTNPISFAVPDGKGGVGMIFDQSTTAVALGRITMAQEAGEPIPEGWAVDAQGRPTTDPAAALAGSLVSTGGAKGWGLGLMAELLAAGMTGSRAGLEMEPLKNPEGAPHGIGDYYLLMDPGLSGVFFDRLAGLETAVARDEGARMPGQARRPADRVDVADADWALACDLAGL